LPAAFILPLMNRRSFLQATVAGAASLASRTTLFAAADNPDFTAIQKEIEKRHDESVERLQQWMRQPSIAAERRGMDEGCDLTMRMLRDAGFGGVTKFLRTASRAFLPRLMPAPREPSVSTSCMT